MNDAAKLTVLRDLRDEARRRARVFHSGQAAVEADVLDWAINQLTETANSMHVAFNTHRKPPTAMHKQEDDK